MTQSTHNVNHMSSFGFYFFRSGNRGLKLGLVTGIFLTIKAVYNTFDTCRSKIGLRKGCVSSFGLKWTLTTVSGSQDLTTWTCVLLVKIGTERR